MGTTAPAVFDPYSVAPLCGGQSNAIAFTGGSPVIDLGGSFTSTSITFAGPPSYSALRTSKLTDMMKIEGLAKKAPDVLFNDANDATFGIMTYVAQTSRHFVKHGLDRIFYFLSPEGKYVDIVLYHPQVSRDDVQGQYNRLEIGYYDTASHAINTLPSSRYDMYDKQNSLWSASYILASVSPTLRNQLLTKAGADSNKGPILWMYLMGILSSSTSRAFKPLRVAFESRKLKSEGGENVARHTIKVRDDFKRLSNAGVEVPDSLLTVIDNMIECSTQPFSVWASTKRIEVSKFLKENMGKSKLVVSMIPNAPTVEALCDEADDEYLSLFEAGLWVAIESKRDKQAAPAAFLVAKINKAIDKLSVAQTNKDDTCWTCGKVGHRSPQCPEKPTKDDGSRKKIKGKGPSNNKPRSGNTTWQTIRPGVGESEKMVRDGRTFHWCDKCNHWRTTHGTSGHTGSASSAIASKPKANANLAINSTAAQANMAEIRQLGSELSELALGAWCATTTDANSCSVDMGFGEGCFGGDIEPAKRRVEDISVDSGSLIGEGYFPVDSHDYWNTTDDISRNWIPVLGKSAKRRKRNTDMCPLCNSIFYSPSTYLGPMCIWCTQTLIDAAAPTEPTPMEVSPGCNVVEDVLDIEDDMEF